jgi:hypothetical protein
LPALSYDLAFVLRDEKVLFRKGEVTIVTPQHDNATARMGR